jgi:NhaA family Na+:H+ antiporter
MGKVRLPDSDADVPRMVTTKRRRATGLTRPVDPGRDHILGGPDADFTLVEYGAYACDYCHAAHEVVASLRDRFGDRLRYVYRHLPLVDRELSTKAAELAEYASQAEGRFWEVHGALMERDPHFEAPDLERLAAELGLPAADERDEAVRKVADARVREDALSGLDSGARVTPTFFINGRRYEGAWDESALAEALAGSLGHRLQTARLDFARWAPSTGVLLLLGTLIALLLSNSPAGTGFERFWQQPFGVRFGAGGFALSVLDWVNHGLLSVFFLVVGLEIKHEFTVGRLASRRAATLPVVAAFGGMTAPALIYLGFVPSGPLAAGWGLTIATDTAFAVALIVLLGDRVPMDLRVFLTAAVIVDDLVAIVVVALFYTESLALAYLVAAALVTALLAALNRWNIYDALPYVALGALLWFCLHEAGVHATLAGVILALVVPTRPPPSLRALMAQAQLVLRTDSEQGGEDVQRHGPSPAALQAIDAIHRRIESPASKVLRSVEPWSSYVVLPVFALANAGLVWAAGILDGHGRLVLAIVLGLVLGKPVGIVAASWVAVRFKVAAKPEAYTWRQLAGAGALAGIGFTMSLFIAGQAFPDPVDFTAAKVAIFLASLIASLLGVAILWPRRRDA